MGLHFLFFVNILYHSKKIWKRGKVILNSLKVNYLFLPFLIRPAYKFFFAG